MALFVLNSTPIIVEWSQKHRFDDFQSLWYGKVLKVTGISRRVFTHPSSIHQTKPHSQLVIRFTSLNSNQGDIHYPSSNKYQWFCPDIHQIVEDLSGNGFMTYIFSTMDVTLNKPCSFSFSSPSYSFNSPRIDGFILYLSQQCWTLSVIETLL